MYIITSTTVQGTMVTSFLTDMLRYRMKKRENSIELETNQGEIAPKNIYIFTRKCCEERRDK